MSIQQRLAQSTRQSASQARFSVKGSICSLRVSIMAARPSHRQTVVSQQQLKPREVIRTAVRGDFETDDARTPAVASEAGPINACKWQHPLQLSSSQSSAVVALMVLQPILAAVAGLLAEQPYAPRNPTTAASQSATSRGPAPWDGWFDLQEAAPVTPTTAAPTGALPQFTVPVAAAQSLSAAASAKPAASQPKSSAQPAGPRRPGPPVKPGQYARRLRASNSRATGDDDSSSSSSSSVSSWAPVAAAESVPSVDLQADRLPTSWSWIELLWWVEFTGACRQKGWSPAVTIRLWKREKESILEKAFARHMDSYTSSLPRYGSFSSNSSNVAPIAAGSAAPRVVAAGWTPDEPGGSVLRASAPAIPISWIEFQEANKDKDWSPAVTEQKWREHKAVLQAQYRRYYGLK